MELAYATILLLGLISPAVPFKVSEALSWSAHVMSTIKLNRIRLRSDCIVVVPEFVVVSLLILSEQIQRFKGLTRKMCVQTSS